MTVTEVARLPVRTPALAIAPENGGEEKAWNFGETPVQGELFPVDYAA
jgi:hypothetical protein